MGLQNNFWEFDFFFENSFYPYKRAGWEGHSYWSQRSKNLTLDFKKNSWRSKNGPKILDLQEFLKNRGLGFQTSDSYFCDLLNEFFHMNKKNSKKNKSSKVISNIHIHKMLHIHYQRKIFFNTKFLIFTFSVCRLNYDNRSLSPEGVCSRSHGAPLWLSRALYCHRDIRRLGFYSRRAASWGMGRYYVQKIRSFSGVWKQTEYNNCCRRRDWSARQANYYKLYQG